MHAPSGEDYPETVSAFLELQVLGSRDARLLHARSQRVAQQVERIGATASLLAPAHPRICAPNLAAIRVVFRRS